MNTWDVFFSNSMIFAEHSWMFGQFGGADVDCGTNRLHSVGIVAFGMCPLQSLVV